MITTEEARSAGGPSIRRLLTTMAVSAPIIFFIVVLLS